MANVSSFPFFRHLRGEPSAHLLFFKNGKLARSGRGLCFGFMPLGASIAEVPLDDRELPFLFHGCSSDFQEVTVEGVVTYRVTAPLVLAERVDFTIDTCKGTFTKQPLDRLALLVTQLAQQLVALNETFVGHRTHQSARYQLVVGDRSERHSSSGLIVATGTGATGWARSIHRACASDLSLPSPAERRLTFLVREAFPSGITGTDLDEGSLDPGERLRITSEMNEGGVAFGDGIESDHIDFHWGTVLTIGIADASLRLVQGG